MIFDDVKKKGYAFGSKQRIFKGQSENAEEVLQAAQLTSNTMYRIVILNTGQEDSVTFDLRIEIIENPQYSLSKNDPKNRVTLPKSIQEIERVKIKSEGVKDSEFIIGNRFMMKWMAEDTLYPFLRKSQ